MNRQEMVATLEVKTIAALTSQALKLPTPTFRRWTQSRGHGHGTHFSVPGWLQHQPEPFRIYYVVHEVCHALDKGHGPGFKRVERRALKRWGLMPRYKRAYPHTLLNLEGEVMWTQSRSWVDGQWVA